MKEHRRKKEMPLAVLVVACLPAFIWVVIETLLSEGIELIATLMRRMTGKPKKEVPTVEDYL